MGCGSSRPAAEEHAMQISRPFEPPGMIPEPRRDDRDVPIQHAQHELSRRNLLKALHYVAEYLHQRQAAVTIVAVGGAVNTILLQSRQSTHDIDFFSQKLSSQEVRLLREAATYAGAKSSIPLGGNWFNNETSKFLTGDIRERLLKAAIQQRDVVFQEPGLTVLAAPWEYAFVSKLGRMTLGPPRRRSYDLSDAVMYLHEWIRRHKNRPPSTDTIREWGRMFTRNTPDEILQEVQSAYSRRFNAPGIGR